MLRVAISIKTGKITPSMILRRLGTYSRKNKLYFAFREFGRVVRTMFLLNDINDIELRRNLHAATNKSEEFNNFTKWLFFGGEGVIAENVRHEQRKAIKYNHLVANLVILQRAGNVAGGASLRDGLTLHAKKPRDRMRRGCAALSRVSSTPEGFRKLGDHFDLELKAIQPRYPDSS